MTHDKETQSTASTDPQQTETDFTLNRRGFLKSVSVSGLVGSTGIRSLSEIVAGAKISDGSSSPDPSPTKWGDCSHGYEKSVRVKGVGSGLNHYHLETTGSIKQREVVDKQQGSTDDAVEGSVRKDDFDMYCFTGRVTTVWARGSVTYYVNDPSKGSRM
jgi:hypothetical protein